MGKQVVYCDGCGRILLEDDFAKARATTADNRNFCVACRPVATAPAAAPRSPTPHSTKRFATSRLQRPPSGEMNRPAAPEAPASKSKTPLIAGVAIGGLVVLVVIGALASGGKGGKHRETESGGEGEFEVRKAAPPPTATPESHAEESDRKAFLKAVEYRKLHPADLAGQVRRFEDVSREAGARMVGEEARRELGSLHRKLAEEREAVEAQAAPHLAAEEFRLAIDVWERARQRYDLPEWTQHAAGRAVAIRDMAAGRFSELRARAVDARRRGAEDEARKVAERVARWGLPEFRSELEKAVAAAEPVKPSGEGPAKAAKEPDAWVARWKAALLAASAGDVAAAAKALEQAALPAEAAGDLDLLRGAAAWAAEGRATLAKTPRGQKVSVTWFDPSGARVPVEGVVTAADAHRIELRQGEDVRVVPLGEVTASALAAASRPKSAREAALLCALEGDADGARKLAADLPARFEALAREIAGAPPGPREAEARRRFYPAEATYFNAGLLFDAVQEYKALLSEFGDTAFVRRNRAAIEARTAAGRDYLLGAGDLAVRGSFRLGRHNKIESCWMSERDVDEAALKTTSVDILFGAWPDAEYKCWVYVGGCCLETFTFAVQGTELAGPDPKNPKETVRAEPGGDAWLPVRLPYLPLKRLHEMHTGPKEPDRWDWIPIPLPRYAAPGVKTVRLLTRQKGFSVAYAVVSARRTGPPRDAEVREAERERAEVPGYGLWKSAGVPTGTILREVWSDVGGTAVEDLRKHPAFPDKPSAAHAATAFETPVNAADNYGTLMRGYVHPPSAGEYVFWVSGDDHCELWLSTDDQPKNKVRIAFVPDWTDPNEWTKYPQQQSAPVALKAGRRYYVEAIQKEGGGGDSLSVGWKLPDGAEERPIPGTRLSPWRR